MHVLRAALILVTVVAALAGTVGARAADEPAPGQAPVGDARSKVEQDLERAAKAAAAGIARGILAAEHGVRVGAAAAARGIERGAQATARAADHVARKLERALPPPAPPGSERTGHPPGQDRHGRSDA